MPRSRLRTLLLLLLALAACLSGAACRHAPATVGGVSPVPSGGIAVVPTSQPPLASPRLRTTSYAPSPESQALAALESRPEYARASEQVRLGKYRPAIDILKRLSADSTVSSGQREFVLDQIDICRSHLGMSPALRPVAARPAAPPVRSPDAADCGPQALALVCRDLGVNADAAKLRAAAGTTGEGTSMAGMVRAAKSVGLRAEGVRVNRAALGEVRLPAIALVSQPGAPSGHHYVVVEKITGSAFDGMATIRDPGDSRTRQVQRETLLRRSVGILLLVSKA